MNRAIAKASLLIWQGRETRRRERLAKAKHGTRRYVKLQYQLAVAVKEVARLTKWLRNHPGKPSFGALALAEARRCVGIMEHGGNNRGKEVEAFQREGGGVPGLAWCGYFVRHCFAVAGSKLVSSSWAAAWVFEWTPIGGIRRIPLSKIRPGDVLEYVWQHTGIAEKVVPGGVQAIEGNTHAHTAQSDSASGGDGVERQTRTFAQIKSAWRVTR